MSGVSPVSRGQDRDVIYGPIFTKFGAEVPHIIQKRIFLSNLIGISTRACASATINLLSLAAYVWIISIK